MPEIQQRTEKEYWTLLWRSVNARGDREDHIMWVETQPLLFDTRREAKSYRDKKYGYIKNRPDLRAAPHGWRLPIPIKVRLSMVSV